MSDRSPACEDSLSHSELKHPICSVEHGFDRAVDFAARDLATPKHLDVSTLKLDVHEYSNQILTQSVHMIKIRKRAGKLVRTRQLDRLQSGCCGRFQDSSGVAGSRLGTRMKD